MKRLVFFICFCWIWPATIATGEDSIEVRLLASNLNPYLGEALVLTMEIIRPESLRQSLSPVWPDMTNLTVEENLPSVARRLTGEGQPRIVENLRRVVRPLRAGSISLEGAAVSVGQLRSTALPLTIRTRPLPKADQPENFNGVIGEINARLESTGQGRRKVTLQLSSRANLAHLASPLIAGRRDRLVPLSDETRGHWPDRERKLQYLFIPGAGETGELRLNLEWFDPISGAYVTAAPETKSIFKTIRWAGPLVIFSTWLAWLLWRWRRYRLLADELDRQRRIFPEIDLLDRLHQAGADPELLQQIKACWHRRQTRFAPGNHDPSSGHRTLPKKLVWKLSARIDKSALHQP